jgi:hypothetical protein
MGMLDPRNAFPQSKQHGGGPVQAPLVEVCRMAENWIKTRGVKTRGIGKCEG